jgi:hypothetical protein
MAGKTSKKSPKVAKKAPLELIAHLSQRITGAATCAGIPHQDAAIHEIEDVAKAPYLTSTSRSQPISML